MEHHYVSLDEYLAMNPDGAGSIGNLSAARRHLELPWELERLHQAFEKGLISTPRGVAVSVLMAEGNHVTPSSVIGHQERNPLSSRIAGTVHGQLEVTADLVRRLLCAHQLFSGISVRELEELGRKDAPLTVESLMPNVLRELDRWHDFHARIDERASA